MTSVQPSLDLEFRPSEKEEVCHVDPGLVHLDGIEGINLQDSRDLFDVVGCLSPRRT